MRNSNRWIQWAVAWVIALFSGVMVYHKVHVIAIADRDMEPVFTLGEWVSIQATKAKSDLYARYEFIALRHPANTTRTLIRQVIALPGETVQFAHRRIYVNQAQLPTDSTTVLAYRLNLEADSAVTLSAIDSMVFQTMLSREGIVVFCNRKQALQVMALPQVQSFNALIAAERPPLGFMWPADSLNYFSPDNYGPVYLPQKGDTTCFDSTNFWLTNIFLTYETGHLSSHRADTCVVWKNNYFFVLANQRQTGIDSRHFGPVPEHLILGNAKRFALQPAW